jgi:NhaP-type Na+/H+ or K+/H+ antiporter
VRRVAWLLLEAVLISIALGAHPLCRRTRARVVRVARSTSGASWGATDPVAVTVVLNEMALPARMIIIPEAESLVNDGMAITPYTGFSEFGTVGGAGLAGLGSLFLQRAVSA